MAVVPKTIAHRVACGFESCTFRQFFRGRSSTELERFATNEQVRGSSPLVLSIILFRGRPAAGRSSLERETKVQILSPKPNIFLYLWAFRRWLYGQVLETCVRWFESSRPDQIFSRRRSPNGRGVCPRNKMMWVRLSPSASIFICRSGGIGRDARSFY